MTKYRPGKNNIYQKLCKVTAMLLLLVFLLPVIGDTRTVSQAQDEQLPADGITDFRDIPNITSDEIAAIEALISGRDAFTVASLHSLDIFTDDDGSYSGFTPLLCSLLSELFDIPFIPGLYEWKELREGIDSGTVDFTTALNMPADMECKYFHTSPLAGNKLSVFQSADKPEIISEYDLRGMRVGFFEQSMVEDIMRRSLPHIEFESAAVSSAAEMADMLRSGDIDAFITDTADVFIFTQYDDIVQAEQFPYIFVPAAIATANENLRPVISAITKFLLAGGNEAINGLYSTGEQKYAAYAIRKMLDEDELEYINYLTENNIKIPVGATANRYPVAFYNHGTNEFQGIAVDVLDAFSSLTGIGYYYKCDENTTWVELEGMLKEGEIWLLTQLIPNEPRKEYAIWPDAPYFTARYALLSNVDFPFLSIDQVPYVSVGFSSGTAEETKFKEWFPESTNYQGYPGADAALNALEDGEIDLLFSLDYTLLYESNYRENANQKINILFDEPIEPVPFGLNIKEEQLCSIISKAQRIINTERIVRNWTSRIFDQSIRIAEERARLYLMFAVILSVTLIALLLFFIRSLRLTRRAEQQALAASNANKNLQVLLDMVPAGIVITKKGDGALLYANKTALDTFNYKSYDDAKGRFSFDFMPEKQPGGEKSVDLVRKMWGSGEGTGELTFIKAGGEEFLARVAFCTINYNDTFSALNVVEDMTAEREQQRKLENIALKEQEANQLKSQFLATMSHEIRTPMNAIIGMAELALRENEAEKKDEHLGTIKQASSNLLAIINDILDFSKIEAGKLEIISGEYDVETLLSDVVNIIRMRVLGTQIDFAVKVDCNVPRTLYGDETRVRQAVLNLLSNAVKYTEKGHVIFTLGSEYIDENTVMLTFEVIDTGIGIKQDDLEKLFIDFTQLDLERHKSIEGIGLGLAITNSIVKEMDGDISVASQYGEGSTFTIKLPQKFKKREALAAVTDREGKNVLVFDNSDVHIDSITYALENLGVKYNAVKSSIELLKKLNSGGIDYLFVSYRLLEKNRDVISRFARNMKIAVLADFGENVADREFYVLSMPAYCTTIAAVLNGEYNSADYPAEEEPMTQFTAPQARVLIVDDIYTNLKVAEGLIAPYGMQIELCNSGAAAIELIRNNAGSIATQFDLVFMDHKMPGMDGVETTKRIREMGEQDTYYKDLPIIALTANVISGMMEMFIESGFNDFLAKPINIVELNTVLEKWIPKEKQGISDDFD